MIRGRGGQFAELMTGFVIDDIIKVDLNSFQTEFIDAHMPINETIKILCKIAGETPRGKVW